MSPQFTRFGLLVALSLAAGQTATAQQGGFVEQKLVKPSGPAAKKADDLIRGYTSRIEKEIDQGHKEVQRLRTELHELIDIRYDMAEAIAELRGELAANGTYSTDPLIHRQPAAQDSKAAPPQAQGPRQGMAARRDLFYGLGSAMPKDPSPQQRDQLRRLAPRSDQKRMIERLRAEVEETRAEVDQLAYKLLELREGIPNSFQGFGGGMGGGMGGMNTPWFGSIGLQGAGGMM
jgi:hypothetical protein